MQIRDIAALREKLQEKADKMREELEMTDLNIVALDSILKRSSFVKASSYTPDSAPATPSHPESSSPKALTKDITNAAGDTIATMHTYPNKISIILDDAIRVTESTPPFQSFFVNRILDTMKKRDEQDVSAGNLDTAASMRHEILNEDGHIREIIIHNYRLEDRVREISGTIKWALTRMQENVRQD